MEIVYRALKQPNAVAKLTGLISNVTHKLNCCPGNKRVMPADGGELCAPGPAVEKILCLPESVFNSSGLRFEFILHQENGAGHLPDYRIITAADQKAFDTAFFMGAQDDQVNLFFPNKLQNFFDGIAFLNNLFDLNVSLCFAADNIIQFRLNSFHVLPALFRH